MWSPTRSAAADPSSGRTQRVGGTTDVADAWGGCQSAASLTGTRFPCGQPRINRVQLARH